MKKKIVTACAFVAALVLVNVQTLSAQEHHPMPHRAVRHHHAPMHHHPKPHHHPMPHHM